MNSGERIALERACSESMHDVMVQHTSAEDACDHICQMMLGILFDSGPHWEEECLERTAARVFWRLSGSYFQEFKCNSPTYRNYRSEQK